MSDGSQDVDFMKECMYVGGRPFHKFAMRGEGTGQADHADAEPIITS